MVEIGGKPVLWHLMKTFAAHGVTDFVICAGYKGEQIKEYFLNYAAHNTDFTITLGRSGARRVPRRPPRARLDRHGRRHRAVDADGRARRAHRAVRQGRALHRHLRRRARGHRRRGAARVPRGRTGCKATITTVQPLVALRSGRRGRREPGDPVPGEAADGRLGERGLLRLRARRLRLPAGQRRRDARARAARPPRRASASSPRTGTTASGSRWTRTASPRCSTRCGRPARRRGRSGSERDGRATTTPASRRARKLISVVIPAYNESDCVDELARRLARHGRRVDQYDFEVIVVENGSHDDTWEKLHEDPRGGRRASRSCSSRGTSGWTAG